MGFLKQEYRSGLPFPSPGALPDPEIKPTSPTLQEDSLPLGPGGSPDKGKQPFRSMGAAVLKVYHTRSR